MHREKVPAGKNHMKCWRKQWPLLRKIGWDKKEQKSEGKYARIVYKKQGSRSKEKQAPEPAMKILASANHGKKRGSLKTGEESFCEQKMVGGKTTRKACPCCTKGEISSLVRFLERQGQKNGSARARKGCF